MEFPKLICNWESGTYHIWVLYLLLTIAVLPQCPSDHIPSPHTVHPYYFELETWLHLHQSEIKKGLDHLFYPVLPCVECL